MKDKTVAVIGLGYVGLTLSVILAKKVNPFMLKYIAAIRSNVFW